MKRVAIAAALSGVIGLVWGFAWWVGLPFANMTMERFDDDLAVAEFMRAHTAGTGVYYFPNMEDPNLPPERVEQLIAAHRAGPIGQVFLRAEGAEPMSPLTFLWGFLHFAISAAMMGALVLVMAPVARCRKRRFALVMFVATFAAVYHDLGAPIWFLHPWPYWIMMAAYHVTTWGFIGLAIALIVKPDEAA